jgi:hypothetical protein
VSEIFPMETRALAIAFFYAVGTAAGGITGPLLFGKLVESGEATQVFWGYMLGAVLMILAGIVQAVLGIEAARKDLEQIAAPISAEEAEEAEEPRFRREREPAVASARAEERPRSDRYERRRRFGPGEAQFSYSPVQQSSSRVPDEDIDEEVATLARALRETGPAGLDRRELGERVNCRRWGPGRFRRALAAAEARGAIRRTARGHYVADESVGAERARR